MNKIRILCYGDSNTWGFVPAGNYKRYGEDERWTRLLATSLDNNFEIIEEGLTGRCLLDDQESDSLEGKNGYNYLMPCLDSHDPIDLIILMLGTNDLKTINNRSAEDIGNILEEYYVKTILNKTFYSNNTKSKLLLVTPPIVEEEKEACKSWNNFVGAYEKSIKLNGIYKDIAERNNCYFVDNDGFETGIDGIHLTTESHKLLSKKLYNIISKIYK